jgi:hypothetical protein
MIASAATFRQTAYGAVASTAHAPHLLAKSWFLEHRRRPVACRTQRLRRCANAGCRNAASLTGYGRARPIFRDRVRVYA